MAVSENDPQGIAYNRSYVGIKETAAYLLNDFSNSFNIKQYENRFVWDVLKIDIGAQALVGWFTGAWDVINDLGIGVMVDKTRTRWGKFRPYLLGFQIPTSLLGMLYWFLPLLFRGTSATYLPKLIAFFAFGVLQETAGTFTTIARSGYMTTITPNPNERGRLILLAELLTGYMGEDMPNIITGLLLDLVNNSVLHWRLSSVFIGMGTITAVVSCVFTLWFFLKSRERVLQSVERPSIKEGFRALLTNKPVLMILLARVLGGFSISAGNGQQDYFIDVLGSATLLTAVNVPSGFVGSASYALVQPLRRRYSSKALWVFEDIYTRVIWIAVFLLGLPNKNYQKRVFMGVLFGLQAFFEKAVFGVRKVINTELNNEAMDYCEWKNGYRVEATTSVVINLVTKIQEVIMRSVRLLLLNKIGYRPGIAVGTQSERTKLWMFALCTGVPVITGALAVVPKFFYPLSGAMRTQMYNELHDRRGETVRAMTGDE